jgi:hypothetical protein
MYDNWILECLTLQMEVIVSSETLVTIYHSTRNNKQTNKQKNERTNNQHTLIYLTNN